MSQPTGEKPASEPQNPNLPQSPWEFGDIGFDTEKKLWFVQLYNEANQNVGTYMGKQIVLRRGRAIQYQWKDAQGRAFWHVRERFFADEIENIDIDPSGALLTVLYKGAGDRGDAGTIPEDYSYILYAFHLMNKDAAKGNKAPLGFLEFYDAEDKLVGRLNNRWIMIEDLDRRSVGEYPKIRLRVERKDIQRIVTTRNSVAIQGRGPRS